MSFPLNRSRARAAYFSVGLILALLGSAPAQTTNFFWTNSVASTTLLLGSTTYWTNTPLPNVGVPAMGGSSNYTLTFSVGTTAQTITNNLGSGSDGGFYVNRLTFGSPVLTFFGSNFVMATSGAGVGPMISNSSARATIINNGVVLSNNTTLTGAGAGLVTINGAISGSGSLTKSGTSTFTLSGSNSFLGGVTLNAGTLSVGSNWNLGDVNGGITFNGGRLQITGTALNNLNTRSVNWTNFNGGLDIASAGNTFTVASNIVGSLSKYGLGTLVLSGSNNLSGAMLVSSGVLQFASANSALGSGRGMNIGAGAATVFDYAGVQTALNNVVAGTSTGTVALTVNSAGDSVDFSAATGAGLSNAYLGAVGTVTNRAFIPFGTTYRLGGGGGTLTYTSVISGTANVVIGGLAGSTVVLSGANTYSGGTTNGGGTLALGADNPLGSGTLVLSGGNLGAAGGGTRTLTNAVVLASAGVVDTTGGDVTLAGPISGTGGGVSMLGTGKLTLSGNNTYASNTTLGTSQTLNINHANALGVGALVVGGNGSFDNTSGAPITLTNKLNLSGGSPIFIGTTNLTINGVTTISGNNRTITTTAGTLTLASLDADTTARTFTKSGWGTLALNGAAGANLAGVFKLSEGTVIVGNNTAFGSGGFWAGHATSGVTLQASTDVTLGNQLILTGTIGVGRLIVSGAHNITFTGGLEGAPSGSDEIIENNLDSGKKLLLSGNLALRGAGNSSNTAVNLTLSGTGNTEIGGNILNVPVGNAGTAAGSVIVAGGLVTFSGNNSYSGATTVNGGVLQLNSANALPANSALTIAGGVLGLGYGDFTLALATTPAAGQAAMKGTAGFAAYGADRTVNFGGAGAAVTWSANGFMVTTAGALILGADSADKTVTFMNPIVLATAGSNTRTNQVNDGAAAIDAILAGGIGSAGQTNSFVKTGAGTLELTGVSSYRGYTTVDSGTLMVASTATNGLGYTINNASLVITGSMAFLQTPTLTLADANARVRVVDGGTLLMDGAFTNSGAITVSGGTLGSTAGMVYQGTSFQFAGSNNLSGPVTISSTFLASNANMTFSGPVTISSLYASDPSTNVFTTNVTVTGSGALSGSNGDLFVFQKDFINQSTNQAQFNLSHAAVLFTNSATHLLSVSNSGSLNIGSGWTNFSQVATNFAIGQLSIAGGNRVTLAGNQDTQTNALYVGWLDIQGAFNTNSYTEVTNALVLALSLPNINLYYDKYDPRNGWLNANLINDSGAGFNLWGGGLLLPIPEPTTLLAAASGLALLGFVRRKSVA